MKGLIWQSKGFQKAQAGQPQARDFKGVAFPSSERPGALCTPEPAWPQAWRERRGEEAGSS